MAVKIASVGFITCWAGDETFDLHFMRQTLNPWKNVEVTFFFSLLLHKVAYTVCEDPAFKVKWVLYLTLIVKPCMYLILSEVQVEKIKVGQPS